MGDMWTDRFELREPNEVPLGEVAICTPAYKSYKYLGQYFDSIYNLDYPKELIHLRFAISGDDPTWEMVNTYINSFGDLYASAKAKLVKQYRGGFRPQFRNVALARNIMVDMAKGLDCLFIDSDTFVPHHTLKSLRNDLDLGADIVGGINPISIDIPKSGVMEHRIALPAFVSNNDVNNILLLFGNHELSWISNQLLGKRLWVDSVGGGIFYATSHVLSNIKFTVPTRVDMGDDVEFFLNARDLGFNILSDFNVYCQHWGHALTTVKQTDTYTYYRMELDPSMVSARKHRKQEKSY